VKFGRASVAVFVVGSLAGLLAGCGGEDGPGTVSLYDRAPVPAVPDRTTAVATPLVDGEYWAELVSVDAEAGTLTFDLMQALFADACVEVLGADGCPNDYGVVDDPHVEVASPALALTSASVVAESQQNYAVTADELTVLMLGGVPSAGAPDDYAYVPFPYLVTVANGEVVRARQIWVP
jgi:hypothetical protein